MDHITIKCHCPGMRRCGQTHEAEKAYPADHWSEEQLQIFDADPHFTVLAGKRPADADQAPSGTGTAGDNGADQNSGSTAATKPEGDELIDAIIAEIKKLENGEKPTVGLMKEKLGYEVAGKELGAAMKKVKAEGGK